MGWILHSRYLDFEYLLFEPFLLGYICYRFSLGGFKPRISCSGICLRSFFPRISLGLIHFTHYSLKAHVPFFKTRLCMRIFSNPEDMHSLSCRSCINKILFIQNEKTKSISFHENFLK